MLGCEIRECPRFSLNKQFILGFLEEYYKNWNVSMFFYIIYFYVSQQVLPAMNKKVQGVKSPNISFTSIVKIKSSVNISVTFYSYIKALFRL